MNQLLRKFVAMGVIGFTAGGFLVACSGLRKNITDPMPAVRIDLSQHGLPKDFFRVDADTKCASQIIGYRFVVWLDNETVAVGFNTSPNCRPSPNQKVHGMARIIAFSVQGTLKASRDLPYDADGDRVLVTAGEGKAGPGRTLLFRIEEAGESKSGILLLDANLKDTARLDRFLEETTFADHALVFQEGFILSGPRTYDTFNGFPLTQTQKREIPWPVGTMDRKFGEHGIAYMVCQQELQPNVWESTNVVYANARRRCRMVAEPDGQTTWEVPLQENGTAVLVGLLADGSVVGQVPVKGRKDRQLVIWKKDQPMETLPWIPPQYCGSIESATANMSRYATRLFPRNGRAALALAGPIPWGYNARQYCPSPILIFEGVDHEISTFT